MRPAAESEVHGPMSDDKSEVIPRSSHLIVTTPTCVYSWDNEGLTEIFRSHSGGIIAAKEAHNGSATLAIADSQVVILHDVKRRMEKSYELKGTEASNPWCAYCARSDISIGSGTPTAICKPLKQFVLHNIPSERRPSLLPDRLTPS